jgi:ABC-type Mn2+/Zn2+ transport system permease subunit
VDLFGYLFGSIIAVGPGELWTTLGLALVVFVLVGLFQKEFLAISFDPEMAQVAGLPVGAFHNLLLCLMALTVVLSLRVVGAVLVAALLVAPAATAYQVTQDFRRMMAYSVAFGVGEAVGGLVLSFYANTAPGATIVLLATAVFGITLALSPRRRTSART